MDMEKRIEALEKAMSPVEWEPVRLMMYITDATTGHDKPDRLSMVIHSGTPSRPGRRYSREPEETEEIFLERIEAAELGHCTS